MVRDYKIYYNDSFVLITADRGQMNENFTKVFDSKTAINNFLAQPDILFDSITNEQILILSDKPGEVACQLMEKVDIVIAGGGLVFNEHNELLLIHRRGHWDMAKGKIELNEDIIVGAEREVTEETGVTLDSVEPEPIVTYHAYFLKNKRCLKQTNWYRMRATPGQTNLVPQTEEDIEDVRWVKKQDLPQYKDGAYPLIWGLIEEYVLQ